MTGATVFTDSSIADRQELLHGITAPAEIVVLDAERDRLALTRAYLHGYPGVDSLHPATGSIAVGPVIADLGLGALDAVLAANTAPAFTVVRGKVITDFGGGDQAHAIAVQPDGRIVVAGSAGTGNVLLARYNANGSLDTTFDGDGKVDAPAGDGTDLVLQSDGKILVATFDGVARYNANGGLDMSFDGDGKTASPFEARSIALQADGKIVVAGSGTGEDDFAVARYNNNGSLDTSFGVGGMLATDFGGRQEVAHAVAVQADGKIVVAGQTLPGSNNYDFAVARYNVNGTLDTSFDGDGRLIIDFGGADDVIHGIALQTDGRILLAGNTSTDFAVVRLNAGGGFDASFDGDGKLTTDFGGNDSAQAGVSLQTDGKILVAGTGASNNSTLDFAVARYNVNGSLDTSFDGDGKVTTRFAGFDFGQGLVLQADGRVLLAGFTDNGADLDFALTRYNANGSLDTSFGGVPTLNGTPTYVRGGTPVILDRDVEVVDPELALQGHYAGAALTLTRHNGASAQDVFSAMGALGALTEGAPFVYSGVSVGTVTTNSSGTLVLTFNGNATQARVNGVLESIAYANNSGAPPSSVQIDWLFSDGNSGAQGTGGPLGATGSTTVAIHTPPTITILWSRLSDGDLLIFDPESYVFRFDDVTISAADVLVTGLPQTVFTYGGMTVTVFSPLAQVTTVNTTFDDGSMLVVGDNSAILPGNDGGVNTLLGGIHDDQLIGMGGDDLLVGEAGADLLNGGAGFDIAAYGLVSAVVANLLHPSQNTGDAAGDSYISIEGLLGSSSNDTLVGDNNDNSLDGVDGDDQLEGGLGGDQLNGGNGFDYARYGHAAAPVHAHLLMPALNIGEAFGDNYMWIEGLVGSPFNDVLSGDNGANDIAGLAGNDQIEGLSGNDNLQGMDGNDTLDGGAGADRLDGGAGADRLNGGSDLDHAIYDGSAAGLLVDLSSPSHNTGDAAGDTYVSVEGVTGSLFDDTLAGDGNANDLQGLDGNDYLQARGGNDTLQGGNGTDSLEGGGGSDKMDGGSGFDYARYRYSTAAVTVDLVTPGNNMGDALGDSYVSIEGVVGSQLNDVLSGNSFVNDIAGLGGNDQVNGRAGNDNLQGMDGNDTLDGGAGSDRLVGGAGNDAFVFKRGEAHGDTIVDFNGNGALAGDTLVFQGYGSAPGATFIPVDATHWRVNSSDGVVHETIAFATPLVLITPTDYAFV